MSDTKVRNSCRVCGNPFFKEPLLVYENMPKAAQHLPDAGSLDQDEGVHLEVCQCSGCSLVQLSNPPVPYFRDVIRAAAYSHEMQSFRLEQFNNFVKKHSLQGKKVLEIGCGKGEFLSLMNACGVDSYGIEHAEESVSCCIQSGLKVSRNFIDSESVLLESAPFDAFFTLNFLEHIPDLNLTLRGIYQNLNEHAIGLVEVPNFDMIIKNRLFSEFISDHIYYFTAETLASTLICNGFEILECVPIWHNYILSATVRKRYPLNLSDFYQQQTLLTEQLQQFINQYGKQKVAVWGAGHQALAVLALAKLSTLIKFVVDSAPFKQGKYTPATHIHIVSPDDIATESIDAVVVMAASYSDEVVDFLKRRYGTTLDVAVLREHGLEKV